MCETITAVVFVFIWFFMALMPWVIAPLAIIIVLDYLIRR